MIIQKTENKYNIGDVSDRVADLDPGVFQGSRTTSDLFIFLDEGNQIRFRGFDNILMILTLKSKTS